VSAWGVTAYRRNYPEEKGNDGISVWNVWAYRRDYSTLFMKIEKESGN